MRILLRAGADVTAVDVDGRTPRFLAEHPVFQPEAFHETAAILLAAEGKKLLAEEHQQLQESMRGMALALKDSESR